jgi:hypothetical protein
MQLPWFQVGYSLWLRIFCLQIQFFLHRPEYLQTGAVTFLRRSSGIKGMTNLILMLPVRRTVVYTVQVGNNGQIPVYVPVIFRGLPGGITGGARFTVSV